MFVFFFKQKTAYEIRISGWSSDVCSSDLRRSVLIQLERTGASHLGGRIESAVDALDRVHPEVERVRQHGQEDGVRERKGELHRVVVDRLEGLHQIGRASCRERVCQYV